LYWHAVVVTASSGETGRVDTIIGVSFDDVYRSQEFLTAITRMNAAAEIGLLDAVVVTKDADGRTRVRETVDLSPGRAAVSGAVWTGLLGLIIGGPVGWLAGLGVGAGAGAVAAKVVDLGIPDAWVSWFREAVEPGTSTIVMLANRIDVDALIEEVSRFEGGHLVYANLDDAAVLRLEHALGEVGIDALGGQGAATFQRPTTADRTPEHEVSDDHVTDPGPWPPPSP
jgi:uncharacterized membrane protein